MNDGHLTLSLFVSLVCPSVTLSRKINQCSKCFFHSKWSHEWFKYSFVSFCPPPESQFQKWPAIKYIWHKSRSVLIANVMKPNHSFGNRMNISIWNAQLVGFAKSGEVVCDQVYLIYGIYDFFLLFFGYHSHLNSCKDLPHYSIDFSRIFFLSLSLCSSNSFAFPANRTLDASVGILDFFCEWKWLHFWQNVNHTTIHLVKLQNLNF